jgi:hypothetical protein
MTISQALKEKNKKVAKINTLWIRFSQYNSMPEGEEKPYSSKEVWEEIVKNTNELVELKRAIHISSSPVREKIFLLSELKTQIARLKGLNITNGKVNDRYSETQTVMIAELDVLWKDAKIEELESTVESLQEELDSFNHTTHI